MPVVSLLRYGKITKKTGWQPVRRNRETMGAKR